VFACNKNKALQPARTYRRHVQLLHWFLDGLVAITPIRVGADPYQILHRYFLGSINHVMMSHMTSLVFG